MLDANKYIDRLRQTVKDVRSLKNDGRGVSFDAETRLNYLLNRCSDLVRDYDRDFDFALQELEKAGDMSKEDCLRLKKDV